MGILFGGWSNDPWTLQEQEKWLADQILNKGKPEYGTPEYWVKERKSKFRRDARQKEEQVLKFAEGIISLWSMTSIIETPFYNLTKFKDNE